MPCSSSFLDKLVARITGALGGAGQQTCLEDFRDLGALLWVSGAIVAVCAVALGTALWKNRRDIADGLNAKWKLIADTARDAIRIVKWPWM